MCDDSPLHRCTGEHPRKADERLAEAELTSFGPHAAGIVRYPGTTGPAPLVVVAPERYGLVQHTVDIAERFAREGWVAISPDFYVGVRENEAHRLPALPDDVVLQHIVESVEYARADPRVDGSRIGFYGVCRSGSWGLLAAARLPEIRSVVMLYGGAQPHEWELSENRTVPYERIIESARVSVLGIFGERDHTMSISDVTRLRNAFERHNLSYDLSIVRDMPHGWINDTMPGRYRAEEADLVWSQMLGFLHRTLDAPTGTAGTSGTSATTGTSGVGGADGTGRSDVVEWTFRALTGTDYDFSANERQE